MPNTIEIAQTLVEGCQDQVDLVKVCRTKQHQLVEVSLKITLGQMQSNELWFNNQIVDIRQRHLSQSNLVFDSHDRTTNLPNQTSFLKVLNDEIRKCSLDQNRIFYVLLINLERLDQIRHGAEEELFDRVFAQIVYRLETSVHSSDTVARLEGDNFGVILRDVDSSINVRGVAQRLHELLKKPVSVEGRELFVQSAIAIVGDTKSYHRGEQIIQDGNLTIAYLRHHGEEPIKQFEPEIRRTARLKLEIASALPRALKNREFKVYYQPIVCLNTGKLYGFEALVRWQHGDRIVSPAQFIPICEETGLIVPLGMELLQSACQTVRNWQLRYPHYADLKISVNLSSKQFHHASLISDIEQILAVTGLSGDCLKLEITESLFINNFETVIPTMEYLTNLGIQFSIDDFGTGFSSLSYLQNLPAHTLKLDRAFVLDIDQKKNYAIAKAVVTLGHLLGMDIIAEGIETSSQLAILGSLNCEYGQGYYFDCPLPEEDVEKYLS